MSGRLDAAEDLVAETLLEAWRNIARFNGSCRLSTWLFSILLHRRQKQIRRAKSRFPSLSTLRPGDARDCERSQEDVPDATPSPSQDLIQKERTLWMRQIIDQLPKKYREVLLMRFFEDASLADIAAALDCPIGTVKSRLHYALEELRKFQTQMNLEDLGRDT
jgi:RNA polymerase sigma-70 factor, ECF subfamily